MDAAIHAPHTQSGSDERNYHAHIMFTGRQIDLETGDFAKKRNRDFNKENSSQTVNQWRETFADLTNQHLARAGHLSKVDHRSYADQDNGLQATIHEGSKVTQLRKQGIDTEISLKNDLIKQQNTEKQHLPEILKGLEQEIRLTESQIDKYKLDMSLETIRKLSSTMETPKPQQKPLDRKIEPSTRIEKPNLSATQQFNLLIQELDKATSRLNIQFIAIYSSAFVALVMVLFLAIFLFVPSMDEIQQRRSEVNNLKQYSLDISKCGGQTCVKVMTKKCGYGESNDYCVIDPK